MVLSLVISLMMAWGASAAPSSSVLIIGMDGVSYQLLSKLRDAGYFRYMKRPAPLIASFPSISDPTWSMIVGGEPVPSYTKEHFDPNPLGPSGRGKHVGSIVDHILKAPAFEALFDYKPEGVLEHFVALTWTETSALAWMDGMEKEFLRTRYARPFFAFNLNTDLISHTKGDAGLIPYLVDFDRRLFRLIRNFRAKYQADLDVVLVSDHGNAYLKKTYEVNYKDPIEKAGFQIVSSLKKPRDVAVVIPEILSFAAFYSAKEDVPELAKTVSKIKGVHTAMWRSGPHQIDFLRGGKDHTRAKLDPKKKTLTYELLSGQDPFSQVHLFKGKPLSWEDYKLESLSTDFPYALVRVWQGFYLSVQKPADVLANCELSYLFAGTNMKIVTSLTGLSSTHGSLHREESLGILVSSKREMPPLAADEFPRYVPLRW